MTVDEPLSWLWRLGGSCWLVRAGETGVGSGRTGGRDSLVGLGRVDSREEGARQLSDDGDVGRTERVGRGRARSSSASRGGSHVHGEGSHGDPSRGAGRNDGGAGGCGRGDADDHGAVDGGERDGHELGSRHCGSGRGAD